MVPVLVVAEEEKSPAEWIPVDDDFLVDDDFPVLDDPPVLDGAPVDDDAPVEDDPPVDDAPVEEAADEESSLARARGERASRERRVTVVSCMVPELLEYVDLLGC